MIVDWGSARLIIVFSIISQQSTVNNPRGRRIWHRNCLIKVTNPDGTTGQKEINVIRSWQESDGRQIFLHTNGVYGYKDESPVLKKEDLNIISDPTQHRLALNWWDRTGKEMSAGFYDARERRSSADSWRGYRYR